MTSTVHTGGRAPRPVLRAPKFRFALAVDEQAGTRVIAGISPADDVPPGCSPTVGVWFQGTDADMDAAALDDFLTRLDDFRDGLRALRLLMGPVWPADPVPAVQAARDDPEGPRP